MTRHGPRLAVATLPWPGTRTVFSLFLKQQRIPGRGNRRLPRSGVHAVGEAMIFVAVNWPTTSYRPPTTSRLSRIPGRPRRGQRPREIRGPCRTAPRDSVAADGSTTCHIPRSSFITTHYALRTKYPVHAGRAAEIRLTLVGPPHATGCTSQASPATPYHVLRTTHQYPLHPLLLPSKP